MVNVGLKVSGTEFDKLFDSYLDDVIDFIYENSQQNIVNNQIVDRGTLLKSGVIIRKPLNKEIVYNVPYADSIEFGRIPGSMPPVQPIFEWVQRKLGVSDEKEAKQIAWAIAQDLKKNGTQPRPFLGPAVDLARVKFK